MKAFDLLRDFFRHMEWADASVWRAVLAAPDARGDARVKELCYHIHIVQQAFFQIWGGKAPEIPELDSFADLPAICAWGKRYHGEVRPFLGGVDEARLAEATDLPWAKEIAARIGHEPEPTTLAEMMTQVTAHSTYHRGQLNARLREVGGEPPLVDYIAWVWHGRPAAEWPQSSRA